MPRTCFTESGRFRHSQAFVTGQQLTSGSEHWLSMPILHSGEMQSISFLDRESDDVWRYYSMVRTGKSANRLIAGNESSAVNRAVAFYRHLVGIPTDQEPPAAR